MIDTLAYDPTFWSGVAFVLFVLLVRKPVGRLLAEARDKRSAQIREELEEALRLKEEAQAVLLAYQKKQRECLQEAEAIVTNTREDAKRMADQAEKELQDVLEKRKKLAIEKIAQAEKQAVQDVQNHMVDIAAAAARALIVQQTAEKESSKELVAFAINEIEQKLH